MTRLHYFLCSFVAIIIFFYLFFLNHVGANSFGVAYNSIGGQISIQEHPGWYITSPTVRTADITTLPITVTIPTSAKVVNSKVVRFRKEGIKEFINLQGFSMQMGSNLESTLLGYTFTNKEYAFIEVLQDMSPPSEIESSK